MPRILYKYRSYEGAKQEPNFGSQTLLDFKLFASSPSNFNDPFDMALPFKYSPESFTFENFLRKYLRMYSSEKKGNKSHNEILYEATDRYNYICENPERNWKENAAAISDLDNKFYGILSLSKKPKDILMWSHYANLHRGYCIGIDVPGFVQLIADNFEQYGCKLGPVTYSDNYPVVDFMKDSEPETTFKRSFTKQSCWKYEDEYRIVFHNSPNKVIKYPKELIKEIYLGCRMSQEHKAEIKEFLTGNDLTGVKLYQMEMGYHKFELESKLLSLVV